MITQFSRSCISIVLISTLLSGCGMFGFLKGDDKEKKEVVKALAPIQEEVRLTKLWGADIGSGLGKKFDKLTPAIDNDRLYIANVNGDVMAFNRLSGKVIWTNKLKLPVTGGVGVGSGLVALGTVDGEVLALSEQNGEIIWRNRVSSEVLSKPVINGKVVIVQTLDDKLFAFDKSNGKKLWVHGNTVPSLTLRGTSTPIINKENVLIAGFSNGKLTGLNPNNGVVRWEQRIVMPAGRSDLQRISDIDGDLLMLDDMIYATSFKGTVVAMNSSTGRTRWQRDIASYVGAGAVDGSVFIADADGKLWSLDERTSSSLWKQDELLGRKLTTPVAYKNYVAVGDYEGYLHLLSQNDGRFVGRLKIGGSGLRVKPVAADNILYVYANNGELLALKTE